MPEAPNISRQLHLPKRANLTTWRSQTKKFSKFLGLTHIKPPNLNNLKPPLAPPQRNLLWIFIIFYETLTYNFMKDKKKIWMTLKIELRRITLPPRETYRCLHEWSLIEMRLTRGSNIEDKWGLSPTERPRYLSGWDSSW